VWRPEGCSEAFTLDVSRFFAEVDDGAPLAYLVPSRRGVVSYRDVLTALATL